ncbi:MAG: hypothetical protein ACYC2I_14065 [Elusimicrobiales bacterium]
MARLNLVRFIALLILGGILAGCNSEKNAIEKTLRSYFKAYYSERTARAYDYLSIEDREALPISDYSIEWGPYAPCYAPRVTMDPRLAKSIKESRRMQKLVAANDAIFNAWLSGYYSQKILDVIITGAKASAKVELTVPVPPTSAIAYVNSFTGDEKKPANEIVAQLKADYSEVIRSTTVVADCRMVEEEGRWAIYKGFAKHEAGK